MTEVTKTPAPMKLRNIDREAMTVLYRARTLGNLFMEDGHVLGLDFTDPHTVSVYIEVNKRWQRWQHVLTMLDDGVSGLAARIECFYETWVLHYCAK